jgi:hypothetical protein
MQASGYIDASFMTDIDDYKSQSGYVFTLNGGAVVWKSFIQKLLRILQQKQNTLRLHKLQRRQSRSRSFLKKLVWSQVQWVQWHSIVIIVVLLLKQRNQDPTWRPGTSSASIELFDNMPRRVLWRCLRFTRIWMCLIRWRMLYHEQNMSNTG